MTKDEIIEALEDEREKFLDAIEGLSDEAIQEPGVIGEWSVKDVIAHVSWHEQQMVDVIAKRALHGSPWWNLPLEERNAAIFALNKDRDTEDVLAESREIFTDLMTQLDTLTEDDLNTAGNFNDMPLDWKPWEMIASNTFEHYPEHTCDIRAAFLKQAE